MQPRVSRKCAIPHHWGLLLWVRRIERSILYHPYLPKSPKISEIVLDGRILSKHSPYQWIFTSSKSLYKCLTPPFKYLRSKGHLSVKYIDDSLFLEETTEICFKIIRATAAVLGFTIYPDKSGLIPSQQTMFLGFVLNSFKLIIGLTDERKQSIYKLYQTILSNY